MPHHTINGTHYFYHLQGKGHPLILISGYTTDHTLWLPFMELLSPHYRVLALDNRGSGQTKDQNQPLSLQEMARDTIALCDELGLEKPHVVGQSMGGTIAQTMAADYGDRIDRLVLLVTTIKWRKAMLLGIESLVYMREKSPSFEALFHAMIPWVFGEAFLSDPKAVDLLYTIYKENPYPQSLEDQKRQFELLRKFDGRNLSIANPTLVVSGKEDIISLPHEGEKLARAHRAKHQVLEGAHGLVTENTHELFQTIHQFLQ